jgi:hypothetical protein
MALLDQGMIKRVTLLAAFFVVLAPLMAYSADVPKLTGSIIKMDAGLSKATAVFVGRITDMGDKDNFPPDMRVGPGYFHVKVELLQQLRGFVNGQIFVQLMAVNDRQETLPTIGAPYIFFVTEGGSNAGAGIDRYSVLKLLPATNDTVLAIQKHK